ncbi:MAG: putative ABC transporter permease [Clostridia bacterium]|nr:putative ABC transporter permease [Clostridia bacterium]
MNILLEYLLLYSACSLGGWWLEVVYRAYRHRKVVNPGFLTGCYLPLYGVGGCILYFLCGLELYFLPYEFLRVGLILLLGSVIMTLIELIGGLISVRIFHVRLWDYSGEWLNYQGLICPKFSLFWGIICALYYFFIYPYFHVFALRTSDLPWMILLVGMFLGVFLVDLAHSMRLMQRVRGYALRMKTLVNIDQLKVNAREHFQNEQGKKSPFNFYRMVGRYMHDMQSYRQQIGHRGEGKK